MAWVASGLCFSSPSFYSYNVSTAELRQARPCVRWLLQDRPPLIGQSWSRDPIPSSHWPVWRMRTSWPPLVHSVVSCIGITRSFTRQESRYYWVPGQPGDSAAGGLYLPTCDITIMPCWHRGLVTPDIRGHFLLSLGSHHSSINPTLTRCINANMTNYAHSLFTQAIRNSYIPETTYFVDAVLMMLMIAK